MILFLKLYYYAFFYLYKILYVHVGLGTTDNKQYNYTTMTTFITIFILYSIQFFLYFVQRIFMG